MDIIFSLVFPPIGALMAYGAGYAASQVVNGGKPISGATKTALRYGPLFVLGMLYAICGFEMFRLPNSLMWILVVGWGVLIIWLARRSNRVGRNSMEVNRS
ncbi:MAG TPA: hypothetical protein VGD60_06695 [Candidatus Acidoferrales bacterium]